MKIYNSNEYLIEFSKGIEPSMKFDESADFASWRKSAKDKLMQLLGLPLIACADDKFQITETEETDEYKKIKFEFQSEEGYFIPCEMLVPLGAQKPLPVAICLQGHSTGKHISLGYKKFESDTEEYINRSKIAVQAVHNGYCAVAFDQRYMGTAGQSENGNPECIVTNVVFPTLLMGRTPIGERVWDVQRVIDVLEKHLCEYVDTERIICMGNSGGGTATFYSAAIDERIHLAVPSCAVCTYDASIIPISHCGCNFIPGIRKFFNMGDIGCLIAPRKLIVVNGDEDPIFPIEGAKESFEIISKAYKKYNAEDKCRMVIGKGAHRFYADDVWPVINEMINI